MASELLKTFQKIEKGRLLCVEGMKKLDYPLDKTSSLEDIGFHINSIQKYNDRLYNIGQRFTPETDPRLKIFPEDWFDIREIFTKCEDFEEDGKIYVPLMMTLFSTDLDTTNFIVTNSPVGVLEPLEKGNVQLGKCNTSASVPTYRCLKFNDRDEFVFLDSTPQTYTHTWDKTKDIVLKNGTRLKYVITYVCITSSSYIGIVSEYINYTGVDLHECITWTKNVFYRVSGSIGSNYTYYGIGGGETFKRLTLISPFTARGKELFTAESSSVNMALCENHPCRELVIDLDKDFNNIKPFDNIFNFKNCPIRSFISNVSTIKSLPYSTSDSAPALIYVKIPYVTNIYGGKLPLLRYLYITPEIQRLHPVTSFGEINLYDTNFFQNITSHENNTSNTRTVFGSNTTTLSFDNLENISSTYFIYQSYLKNVYLPKIKTLYKNIFNQSNIEHISMPSLETVDISNWLPRSLKYLELSSLKDFSKITYFTTSGGEPRLLYLDVSAIENTSIKLSSAYSILEWIVLPDNITMTTVDISLAHKLHIDCVLDIFNKLADVTEDDDIHTIKIGNHKYYLTEEQLSIAIDKGWVVE